MPLRSWDFYKLPVISGKLDKTVGSSIRPSESAHIDFYEKISGSQLYIYPNFGHSLYMEAKDFYPRVKDFL